MKKDGYPSEIQKLHYCNKTLNGQKWNELDWSLNNVGQSEALDDGTNRLSRNTITNYQDTRHKIPEEQRSPVKVSRDCCNVNLRIGPEKRWNLSQKNYSSEPRVCGPHCAHLAAYEISCAKAKYVLAKQVPFTYQCAYAIFHYQKSVIWKEWLYLLLDRCCLTVIACGIPCLNWWLAQVVW
jgi:hypothetical protein